MKKKIMIIMAGLLLISLNVFADNVSIDSSGNVGIGTTSPAHRLEAVDSSISNDDPAVLGRHAVTDYYGVGVRGEGLYKGVEGAVMASGSSSYVGVDGYAGTSSGAGTLFGVRGYSIGGANNIGVYGSADTVGAAVNYGVYGYAEYGETNYAGYFSGNVHVSGTLTAGNKLFTQPHVKDPSKEINYIAVEGPEAMVFYRGTGELKDGTAVIELPEYFSLVAAENGVQVQVTSLSTDTYGIAVVEQKRDRIVVKELKDGKSSFKFNYSVTAVRAGFEEHQVVAANTHFKPEGNETAKDFEARYNSDDISTRAIKAMLISNGILTQEGKLNMAKLKELGWTVAEERTPSGRELKAGLLLKE